mmetsp:Transcript_10130/g.37702  ORF Transcript_10130/g.37702 Transcript_10130/m.37702 type:complete len:171 (-) Transcript_10130:2543-3055(-)
MSRNLPAYYKSDSFKRDMQRIASTLRKRKRDDSPRPLRNKKPRHQAPPQACSPSSCEMNQDLASVVSITSEEDNTPQDASTPSIHTEPNGNHQSNFLSPNTKQDSSTASSSSSSQDPHATSIDVSPRFLNPHLAKSNNQHLVAENKPSNFKVPSPKRPRKRIHQQNNQKS